MRTEALEFQILNKMSSNLKCEFKDEYWRLWSADLLDKNVINV